MAETLPQNYSKKRKAPEKGGVKNALVLLKMNAIICYQDVVMWQLFFDAFGFQHHRPHDYGKHFSCAKNLLL